MVKPKNSSDFQRCLVRIARYADLLSLGISLNPSDSESDATKVRNGTLFTHDFFALKFQKLTQMIKLLNNGNLLYKRCTLICKNKHEYARCTFYLGAILYLRLTWSKLVRYCVIDSVAKRQSLGLAASYYHTDIFLCIKINNESIRM